MKICIVAQTFAPQEEGGAEIVARRCAAELAKHHEIVILSLGLEGDSLAPPGESRNSDGIRVLRINWHNSYLPGPRKPSVGKLAKLAWHIRSALGATSTDEIIEVLQREEIDLVYAHNSARMQPALFDATSRLGIPLCLHLHDYALLCPKSSMFRSSGNCESPCLECRLLTSRIKSSDGTGVTAISVSEALQKRFVQNGVLPKADWHVMHNTSLSQEQFPDTFVQRFAPGAEKFTFAYIGALSEEKGIADLLTAFRNLPRHLDTRLIVAGRGKPGYEAELKELVVDAQVDFLGFVTQETVYSRADAIIVPSVWHEPQGMILIEAASYGIPVIGTNRGGIPEILQNRGTGWCYDPDRPNDLTAALERALKIGQNNWWRERDINFPGIRSFQGTAKASQYYEKLNDILINVAQRHGKSR